MKKLSLFIVFFAFGLQTTLAANSSSNEVADFMQQFQSISGTQITNTTSRTSSVAPNWKNANRFLNEIRLFVKTR